MTSDTGQREEIDALAAIKIPEFKFLLTGRFLFTAGLRMMSTLVAWWIYQLTHSAFAIGVVGLSEFLPAFGLALYAGYVIDISEKKWMLQRGSSQPLDCNMYLWRNILYGCNPCIYWAGF
jgi:hypothetical protein